MKITKEVSAAVQLAMLETLERHGVDVDDPAFAMVVMLVEPNGKGPGAATMHMGAYHLEDDEVLEIVAEASNCIAHHKEREGTTGASS